MFVVIYAKICAGDSASFENSHCSLPRRLSDKITVCQKYIGLLALEGAHSQESTFVSRFTLFDAF